MKGKKLLNTKLYSFSKQRIPIADACQVVSATGSLRCIILKLDMLTRRITKSKPSLIIFVCNNKIT